VTPEELANLAHLRRARDLMDREYARPLDVAALASVPGCVARDLTRPSRRPSRIGEARGALAS
jgi:transcriptional regulator GlxA family with amidase domain